MKDFMSGYKHNTCGSQNKKKVIKWDNVKTDFVRTTLLVA